MRTTGRRRTIPAAPAAALLLLALSLWLPAEAGAQWTSAGGNTTTTDRVGIGTTTPGNQLVISAAQPTAAVNVADSSSFGNIVFKENGASRAALQYVGTAFSATPRRSALELVTFGAYPLSFWTNGSERMRVAASGYVGVGTSAPESLFHVANPSGLGDFRLGGTTGAAMTFIDESAQGSQWRYQLRSEQGLFRVSLVDNTNGQYAHQNLLVANSAGRVGIGTANPGGRLHVTYGTNAWSFLAADSPINKGLNAGASWATANGTQLTFNAYGGGAELITEIGANYAVHGGTGTDRYAINGGKKAPVIQMSADAGSISLFGESGAGAAWRTPTLNLGLHVSAGGNVGVGTATPGYRLDVAGSVNASGLCLGGTCKNSWSEIAGSGGSGWTVAGTTVGLSNSSANVGVGTDSPRGKMEVAGGSLFLGDMGQAGWGNVVMRGRVISASNNIHISPPGGAGVYIDSNYREAGGSTGAVNLHVSGDVIAGGNISAKFQDVAEWVPSVQKLAPGTVVVLDTRRSNHVVASSSAYDTRVAGVVSAQPGISLGEAGAGKALVATTGRVRVKADATRGAICIGDLLVTGEVEGVAMKSVPVDLGGTRIHRPGTIIGKALEPLEKGTGEILVLLSLQ
jgi:hypothetical protein